MTLLKDFYNENVLKGQYKFSTLEEYYILQEGELEDYYNFVCQLPEYESP